MNVSKALRAVVAASAGALLLSSTVIAQDSVKRIDDPAKPDTQMKAVLDALATLNPKPIETLTPAEARKQPTIADAALVVLKNTDQSVKPLAVGNVDNKSIDNANGNIPIRVYSPTGDGPFPVLVYYHGGGFVIADLDTYDSTPRALSNAANCVVVSVEYRHAPENKYPAAVDDAYAAYQWVVQNPAALKGIPGKVAVGGESAGGALATIVSIKAVEESFQKPVHQLLVYPVTTGKTDTESAVKYAMVKPLNTPMLKWFYGHYLADASNATSPHVAPILFKDLGKLPPATIINAEIDPLRDDGKMYADKLKEAGVMVEHKVYPGVTHEFFGLGAVVDKAKEANLYAGEQLKMAFAK